MRGFAGRLAAVALVAVPMAVSLISSPAMARTIVSVGIGVPGPAYYGPPPYAYGPPAYYYAPPPPVYVVPPPTTYVIPAPAPVVQGPAPAAMWYYCDNPQGYYPSVPNCSSPWRPVQPTPQ
jgi:hypothetical protein